MVGGGHVSQLVHHTFIMLKFLRGIEVLFLSLSAICTAGFLVVVSLQVFYRFVLELPFVWSEEAARYLFVWAAFLGAAVAIGRREHFSITLIKTYLTRRGQWVLEIFGVILVIVFCLLMIWFGSKMSLRFIYINLPIIPISQGFIYSVIPLSGLYGVLHLVVVLRSILSNGPGTLESENP